MKKREIERNIINNFRGKNSFTRTELFNYMEQFDSDLNERTIGWRVFDLKKRNIIHSVGRGIYKISTKNNYKPSPEDNLIKVGNYLNSQFSEIEYVIWNTNWINEFSIHQAFNNFIIVEVESDLLESVYFSLLDFELKDVFIKPDRNQIYYKVIQAEDPIIIKSIISRSPLQKIKKVHFPTIEKIIVDLISDVNVFYMYQGNELDRILQNIFDRYNVNLSKMINYANRRNKGEQIKNYLINNIDTELGANN